MKGFSATAFATAAVAMLPGVLALNFSTTPAANFGYGDRAVVLFATIFATVLLVFAPFSGWSMGATTQDNSEQVYKMTVKSYPSIGGIVFSIFWGLVKLIGQIGMAIVFTGYILHEYIDQSGSSLFDPSSPLFSTWYMWIVTLIAIALRLDLLAAEWFHRLQWNGPAAIVAAVETAAWILAVIFLFVEIADLDDNFGGGLDISQVWETWLVILSCVWILVSVVYLLKYALATAATGFMGPASDESLLRKQRV